MNRVTLSTLGAVVAGLLAVSASGCISPGSLGYLLRDTKARPEHPLPAIKDKKEIAVLIIGSRSQSLGMDPMFAAIDRQLPGLIARQMMADTKDEKHPIVVIEQSKLDKWKQTSGADIRTVSPAAVGKQLGADYVIDVTVNAMSVFQPELAREFCKGKASVDVVVFDCSQADKKLQEYTHNSTQPERSTGAMSPKDYAKWFTERLAKEIAFRHIPHDSNERLAMIK